MDQKTRLDEQDFIDTVTLFWKVHTGEPLDGCVYTCMYANRFRMW